VWRRSSNEKLGSAVGAGLGGQGQAAGEEAEVVVGPEFDEGDEGAAGGEEVAGEGPAGVEVAHQVAAGGARPGEDLEGIASQPADFVEIAVDSGVLMTFDQEGVEAGAGLGLPLGGQVDVAVQAARRPGSRDPVGGRCSTSPGSRCRGRLAAAEPPSAAQLAVAMPVDALPLAPYLHRAGSAIQLAVIGSGG